MNISFNFEELKNKVQSAAGVALKKAESLTGLAKANFAIHQEEEKIKKAEAELGRMYYNDFISGAEADAASYQAVCDRITASKVLIEGMKAEIADLGARNQGDVIVEEDEITDADFAVYEETAAPAAEEKEEAAAEAAPAAQEEAPAAEESEQAQ